MPYTTPASVKAELNFTTDIVRGASGMKARRVQEWLTFHGFATAIDGSYGPATEKAVKAFQAAKTLPATGKVNKATWDLLVSRLNTALCATVAGSDSYEAAVLKVAKAHLAVHPIELGGSNCGPWVRVYCGSDGLAWCAGFVTFILKQTCFLKAAAMPIAGSNSVDTLVYQAKAAGRFIRGASIKSGAVPWSSLGKCQIFVVRATSTDWTHAGFSFNGSGTVFTTIEGNSNNQVRQRTLSITSKDIITIL